jgi:hypothetical protein
MSQILSRIASSSSTTRTHFGLVPDIALASLTVRTPFGTTGRGGRQQFSYRCRCVRRPYSRQHRLAAEHGSVDCAYCVFRAGPRGSVSLANVALAALTAPVSAHRAGMWTFRGVAGARNAYRHVVCEQGGETGGSGPVRAAWHL